MGRKELNKREKQIRSNFATIFILLTSIFMMGIAGWLFVINWLIE